MADSVVYTDDFTYADGDLAGNPNWERHNEDRAASWQVVSNVASLQNSNQRDNVQLVASQAHSADQYVEVDCVSISSSSNRNIGLGLRMQPPSGGGTGTEDMYRVVILPDGGSTTVCVLEVSKYVAGASTTIATGTTTFTMGTGDPTRRFRAEIVGYTIKGFIDGVEMVSAVDAGEGFASGQPGVHGFQPSNIDYDNWESGEIVADGPTVDADASVSPGDTINHAIDGFEGSITTATLSDGTSTVSLGSVSDTDAVMPGLGDDIQYTTFGAGRTYTVSNEAESAEDETELTPPSGYALVTLGATFNTDEPSYLFEYGGTPATGDQFIYPTADSLVLNDDGSWSVPTAGEWTIYGIDATDGIMQSFPLTAGDPEVPASAGKMTRRNLTRRAMTRRSLTTRQ